MRKYARVEGWRDNLTLLLNDTRNEPFEWGSHDCCILAGKAVEAVTGENFLKGVKYDTPEGAYKVIRKVFKADNIKDLFSSRFEEVHVAYARAGDLVYRNSNMLGFNAVVGVCYGLHSFFLSEDMIGFEEVDTITLDGAFRVG